MPLATTTVVAVLLMVATAQWYLWWRLVRDTTRPDNRLRAPIASAMALLALLPAAALIGSRTLPPAAQRIVAWPGYLWLTLVFYLTPILLALELPALPVRIWLRLRRRRGSRLPHPADRASRGRADETRRRFLARSVAAAGGLATLGIVGTGLVTALGRPRRQRIHVALAKLPCQLDGLAIAVVSDLHLGPILGQGYARDVVEAVNDFDPDIVAVVGDLVDGPVPDLRPAVEPLRRLRSRLGGYFVTGNHEYYSGFEAWIREITSLGLRVLRNERVEVGGLYLAGVNDIAGGYLGDPPDYERALGGRDLTKPTVLLAHQPVQALEAARWDVDLQLSGHTHGGQLWPFDYVVAAGQPVVSGLGRVGGMPVFVTDGAGSWGPPVRVGAPPQVALVVLHAA